MNWEAFITCAVTGAGDTTARSGNVPVTPAAIAESAIEAAEAGAAIVHIHVRDPATGRGSRDPGLYRDVVQRIRSSGVDVVLNLTAGMGGDLVLGGDEAPLPLDTSGTDMVGATERLIHVEELLPEICTLDCGSMNFAAGGDYVMVNTPGVLRAMAARVQQLGVRPELEVFDTGGLVMVEELLRRRFDRRSAHDPALHGYSVRRSRRSRHPACDGQPAACKRRLLGICDRGGCRSPSPRSRCWWAAMSGSGWRTTSTSAVACSRPTVTWSNGRVALLDSMNVQVLGPEEVRDRLDLVRRA
jgi:uncharacterized protein (DUF849 family)